MGRGLHRARWVLWMAGLLVPAGIVGQQAAPPPPPPVLTYGPDTPPPAPPAAPPTETPPPSPGPAAEKSAAPAAPEKLVPLAELKPIAVSGDAAGASSDATLAAPSGDPKARSIRPVSYTEGEAPEHGPAERDRGSRPTEPPPPDSPSGSFRPAPGSSATVPSGLRNNGLIMDPEPRSEGRSEARPEPATLEKPPTAIAGEEGGHGARLVLETDVAPRVLLGKPVQQRIVVRNIGSARAAGVRVEQALPRGAHLLRSQPPAAEVQGRLAWDLGAVEAGKEQQIQVDLEVPEPMTLELVPVLRFAGVACEVVLPDLGLTMQGPAKALRGETVSYRVQVVNNSKSPLYQLHLVYTVPEGLKHPGGKRVGLTITELRPGESRLIHLEVAAEKAGTWVSRIAADGDNGLHADAEQSVEVAEPMLSLRLVGPGRALPGQESVFQVELGNPGPTPATQVRIVQILPPGLEPVATDPPAQYDRDHRSLTWKLSALPVGKELLVRLKGRMSKPGDWPLYTLASADNRGQCRTVHAFHVEEPLPLAIEVASARDALDIQEATVYEVHIMNVSRVSYTNVRVTAQAADTLVPLAASGATPGQVQKQQVVFAPLPTLAPSQHALYRIQVRGQQAGPGWLRVQVNADRLAQPLQQEVHTTVRAAGNRTGESRAAN